MISEKQRVESPIIQDVLEQDWSFAHLKRSETLWGPHGYHRYPAKFIPQLVRRIIEIYSEPGDLVGDLFVGSGTTGIEALRTKRSFFGSDINPIALLISRAKCTPIRPEQLEYGAKSLLEQIDSIERIGRRPLSIEEEEFIHSFDLRAANWQDRLLYWFPQPHQIVIGQLLETILKVEDRVLQQFFFCGFSNILRRCSIWLSGSTKPQKDLKRSLGDPIEEFQKQLRDMAKRNKLYWDDLSQFGFPPTEIADKLEICFQDARTSNVEDNFFDLLVTSPPYATCYDYRQLHQLTELWFERYGIIGEVSNHLPWIGSDEASTRSALEDYSKEETGSYLADKTLRKLESRGKGENESDVRSEARALRYYFLDMHQVMREFYRVIAPKKRLALVIGDSYKRGVDIPTSDILQEIAEGSGFTLEQRIARRVPGRVLVSKRDRKTGRFSSTATSDIEAYPEEYILVFRKTL